MKEPPFPYRFQVHFVGRPEVIEIEYSYLLEPLVKTRKSLEYKYRRKIASGEVIVGKIKKLSYAKRTRSGESS